MIWSKEMGGVVYHIPSTNTSNKDQQLHDLFASFLLGELLFTDTFKVVYKKAGRLRTTDVTITANRTRMKNINNVFIIGTQASKPYIESHLLGWVKTFGPEHYEPNIGVFVFKKHLKLTKELMTQFHRDPKSVLEYVSVSAGLITPPLS